MNFNDFVSECCNYLNDIYDDVTISEITVTKNNGLLLTGLQFLKAGSNLAPTIYMEQFFKDYECGRNFYKVCDEIIKAYENAQLETIPDIDFFCDYDRVKERLYCRVINLRKNEKLLEAVPYVECMDLAIVFYVKINIGSQRGTILIRNEHFNIWNVELGKMYQDALHNTSSQSSFTTYSIEDVILEILSLRSDDSASELMDIVENNKSAGCIGPMYVFTNEEKFYGASGILAEEELAKFADKINKDFYILPSSVHELILVPDNDRISADALREMVLEVNATQVSQEEILSDSVYKYSRLLGKVVLADDAVY